MGKKQTQKPKQNIEKRSFKIYQTTALKGVGVHSGLHVKEEGGKWYFLPLTTTPQRHYKFVKNVDTGEDNPRAIFLGTRLISTDLKNRKRLTKKTVYPEDIENVNSIVNKALINKKADEPDHKDLPVRKGRIHQAKTLNQKSLNKSRRK